ncbi:unnamed protein product [Plutella xylostella]|uniref:(diamondback moth) hypothetical protein n=1 Tax=Plutella xylostella TaxID=51655 RepID=A0A8S4G050_PLUXY|nr:unnamed protein product [Plutella xylostella]
MMAACICENLQWDAVNVMFGLISCHIPLQLKAELCLTLAALGGYAATAPRVAAALDAAQLVSSDSRGRGLAADLAEVECRIEEYPLSRAFLTLLISLSKNSPMALAGAALEPCTRHALELALRHQHRSYAKPVEKTQILSLCLELLVLWLSSYTPSSADLTGRAPPPLHVALRLHSGDELLRMILTTLREAVDELPNRGPQQPYIEKCAIHCMQLLERGLAMERALAQAAGAAGRALVVVGLSKLLLDPLPQLLAQAAGAAGRALVVVGLSKLLLGVPKEECPLLAACRALSTPAVRVWAPAVALLTRCCSPAAAARLLPHADTYTR